MEIPRWAVHEGQVVMTEKQVAQFREKYATPGKRLTREAAGALEESKEGTWKLDCRDGRYI